MNSPLTDAREGENNIASGPLIHPLIRAEEARALLATST